MEIKDKQFIEKMNSVIEKLKEKGIQEKDIMQIMQSQMVENMGHLVICMYNLLIQKGIVTQEELDKELEKHQKHDKEGIDFVDGLDKGI